MHRAIGIWARGEGRGEQGGDFTLRKPWEGAGSWGRGYARWEGGAMSRSECCEEGVCGSS